MKVFLDTNVLLDILSDTRPSHADAVTILQVIKKGRLSACLTTQSIIDASYVRTQSAKGSVEQFREAIRTLSAILDVVSIERFDLDAANNCQIPDYEDAAQIACALNNGCDAIITGDRSFGRYTSLPVYSPAAFCNELFSDGASLE
ncbi:MAG: PIN domain-containing protein [Bacteroidales bacterium]|jgi:predicted nucleic acid-binding protein|nr:PIN domain-containing protein [Bacteroidales bacterium]